MKKALITGVTGQDGSYLSEFLLKKDCFHYHQLTLFSYVLNSYIAFIINYYSFYNYYI